MTRLNPPKMIGGRPLRPESLMMSHGYTPEWSEGAVKCPVFQTSTFAFRSAEEGKAFFEVAYGLRTPGPDEKQGLIYSRVNNPDLEILEDRLTLWDEAEAAAVFDSGMAAISTTLLELLRPGDVLLHSNPIYGGTDYLVNKVLPKWGVRALSFVAGSSVDEIEALIDRAGVRGQLGAIFLETPANPTNALIDMGAVAGLARQHARADRPVPVIVDNTFLGPLWQRPLSHGADLVIYSATKFIGGHSDLIAGAVLGNESLINRIRALRTILGNMTDPWTGWLMMRSLETLKLRMTCQMKSARHVADFLADHPKVARVYYLGHLEEGTEQHRIFKKQCLSAGSMVSFDVVGGEAEAFRLLNALELIKLAVSLGGTESLAEHPYAMTHSDVSAEEKQAAGMTEAMVRLSVGVENHEDLIADLAQALEAV
ncbi:MAG: cystathionine gamma-synthase family protein [Myxococcota bacterium]